MACIAPSTSGAPVIRITGRSRSCSRTARSKSMPVISGIRISLITTSSPLVPTSHRRASRPLRATTTSWPKCSSTRWMDLSVRSSSSTTSTRPPVAAGSSLLICPLPKAGPEPASPWPSIPMRIVARMTTASRWVLLRRSFDLRYHELPHRREEPFGGLQLRNVTDVVEDVEDEIAAEPTGLAGCGNGYQTVLRAVDEQGGGAHALDPLSDLLGEEDLRRQRSCGREKSLAVPWHRAALARELVVGPQRVRGDATDVDRAEPK